MKRSAMLILGLMVLLLMGCGNNISNQNETFLGDDELILAIQNATNKQVISTDEIPNQSQETLDEVYSEYMALDALIAPELGYEVSVAGRGDKLVKSKRVYFDLDGQELRVGKNYDDKAFDGEKDVLADWNCFQLVYPITYNMPDGSEIIIADRADRVLIRNWYIEHPDYQEKPTLVYPVDIVYPDGTILTINDVEEMRAAKAECRDQDNDPPRRCFQLVYPVTYSMPDGSEIVIAERADRALIRNWYLEHPDFQEKPTLVYPVDIVYPDGSSTTINNSEEMRAAKRDCRGAGGPGGGPR